MARIASSAARRSFAVLLVLGSGCGRVSFVPVDAGRVDTGAGDA